MTARARLGLVILAVADLPQAVAFHRAAFGWSAVVETPVYVEFALPADMRLGLYERGAFARTVGTTPTGVPSGSIATSELYLYPDDLEATAARLVAAGARPLSPLGRRDWGDDVAYFADPDGNVLALARPSRP